MVGLDSRVCPGGPNTVTVDSPGGPQSGGGGHQQHDMLNACILPIWYGIHKHWHEMKVSGTMQLDIHGDRPPYTIQKL